MSATCKWSITLLTVLLLWIGLDLLTVRRNSLRSFDPVTVARLETDMWRSYYEHRRLKLFVQLSRLMREQFHASWWRSYLMAYQAAKAATVFQDGHSRETYQPALSYLSRYFAQIQRQSVESFDVTAVANNELEWWIIRREPQYKPAEWEKILCAIASAMYQQPEADFRTYAHWRVQAMVYRDHLGAEIGEAGWQQIFEWLKTAWTQLHGEVQLPGSSPDAT